jgi:hypothetical protein
VGERGMGWKRGGMFFSTEIYFETNKSKRRKISTK